MSLQNCSRNNCKDIPISRISQIAIKNIPTRFRACNPPQTCILYYILVYIINWHWFISARNSPASSRNCPRSSSLFGNACGLVKTRTRIRSAPAANYHPNYIFVGNHRMEDNALRQFLCECVCVGFLICGRVWSDLVGTTYRDPQKEYTYKPSWW